MEKYKWCLRLFELAYVLFGVALEVGYGANLGEVDHGWLIYLCNNKHGIQCFKCAAGCSVEGMG